MLAYFLWLLNVGIVQPRIFWTFESLVAGAVAFWLVAATHELGHALAGAAAGYAVSRIDVWPLAVQMNGPRLCLANLDAPGATYVMPRRFEGFALRTALLSLGGTAANLMMLAATLWAMETWQSYVSTVSLASPLWQISCVLLVAWTSVFSLPVAIAGLLPEVQQIECDATSLYDAIRQNARFGRYAALMKLSVAIEAGERPRDLSSDAVRKVLIPDDNSRATRSANTIAFAHYAKVDTDLAARYLERALQTCSNALDSERRDLGVECAVFQAWFRRNRERALSWADAIGLSNLPSLQRLRVEAALFWSAGEASTAMQKVEEALVSDDLASSPRRAALEPMFREWLEEMRQASPTT